MVAMLDIAQWKNANTVDAANNPTGEQNIRNAYGFIPAVEYFPWADLNIKFLQTMLEESMITLTTQRLGSEPMITQQEDLP